MPASQVSDGTASTQKQVIRHTPPKHADHLPTSSPLIQEVDVNDDESSAEEYLSFEGESDSESEASEEGQTEEQQQAEYAARELERQRVLVAAGLIVKHDATSAPRPPARTKSLRTHRPAPAVPNQSSQPEKSSPMRDLPPIPVDDDTGSGDPILRVDDAFDRYEAYKDKLAQRVSIASSYDTPTSPSASSMTLGPTLSRDESRGHSYSGLWSFLGRRTPVPESDKRSSIGGLTISGPITNGSIPSPESSPAFGSVSTCVSYDHFELHALFCTVLVQLGRQNCP